MSTFSTSAFVATDNPARYIARLCRHFAHKIPAPFDERQGRVEFDAGLARLEATASGLSLRVEAHDPEALERLRQVIERHFERVAWQAALRLDWSSARAGV